LTKAFIIHNLVEVLKSAIKLVGSGVSGIVGKGVGDLHLDLLSGRLVDGDLDTLSSLRHGGDLEAGTSGASLDGAGLLHLPLLLVHVGGATSQLLLGHLRNLLHGLGDTRVSDISIDLVGVVLLQLQLSLDLEGLLVARIAGLSGLDFKGEGGLPVVGGAAAAGGLGSGLDVDAIIALVSGAGVVGDALLDGLHLFGLGGQALGNGLGGLSQSVLELNLGVSEEGELDDTLSFGLGGGGPDLFVGGAFLYGLDVVLGRDEGNGDGGVHVSGLFVGDFVGGRVGAGETLLLLLLLLLLSVSVLLLLAISVLLLDGGSKSASAVGGSDGEDEGVGLGFVEVEGGDSLEVGGLEEDSLGEGEGSVDAALASGGITLLAVAQLESE